MDLIELLNKPFKGIMSCKFNYEKIAQFIFEKGYYYNNLNDTILYLFEQGPASIFIDSFLYEFTVPKGSKYNNIAELLLDNSNLKIKYIQTLCIDDEQTVVDCEDEMQLEYVEWWCNYFNFEYEKDGYSIIIKDFSEENLIIFCFVYESDKVGYSCAIDYTYCDDEGLYNELIDYIASKANNKLFFEIDNSRLYPSKKIFEKLMSEITDTKEVVF